MGKSTTAGLVDETLTLALTSMQPDLQRQHR